MNDDRLMAFVRTGIQELALTRDVQAHFLGDSPVTKRLADVRAIFSAAHPHSHWIQTAAELSTSGWSRSSRQKKVILPRPTTTQIIRQSCRRTRKKRANTPLTIAAAAEKGGSADTRVQVNSSRLVATSNSTFVQDNAIMQDQAALDFVSGAVNWLLSREQMIGIAPKIPKPLTFSLDPEALRQLRWIVLILLPLIPAAIGTVVWWQRRV